VKGPISSYSSAGQGIRQDRTRLRFYTGTNFGLFYAYWNGSYEIYKGSMYVDLERTPTPEAKRHLLREELTQALGLMNDIQQEPESLFHGYWTGNRRI
jgi:hypothetical protein